MSRAVRRLIEVWIDRFEDEIDNETQIKNFWTLVLTNIIIHYARYTIFIA